MHPYMKVEWLENHGVVPFVCITSVLSAFRQTFLAQPLTTESIKINFLFIKNAVKSKNVKILKAKYFFHEKCAPFWMIWEGASAKLKNVCRYIFILPCELLICVPPELMFYSFAIVCREKDYYFYVVQTIFFLF